MRKWDDIGVSDVAENRPHESLIGFETRNIRSRLEIAVSDLEWLQGADSVDPYEMRISLDSLRELCLETLEYLEGLSDD